MTRAEKIKLIRNFSKSNPGLESRILIMKNGLLECQETKEFFKPDLSDLIDCRVVVILPEKKEE